MSTAAPVRLPGRRTVLRWPGRRGRELRVHLALPGRLGEATRLCVVLHGVERNAAEYGRPWLRWAAEHDRVVAVPHFDRSGWPGAREYVLGGVLDADGRPRPRSRWSYAAVTDLAEHLQRRLGLRDAPFELWGHSAGAQFVHRYLLFEPHAPVCTAVAANAGWYTLPDPHRPWPYGLASAALTQLPVLAAGWTQRPLVLMRGTADVVRDSHLRTTPEAEAQGPSRYARAATMLAAGRAAAPGCRWRLVDVPGVGHDFVAMAAAGQALLAGAGPS